MVYGYMNRGVHEGSSGLAAYNYNVDNNTTEELIFIPMEESYKVTERNVEKLAYINDNNILYFYHNRSIYYMNYETKECMLVDNNVLPEKCMLSGENILMYQTGDMENNCSEIKIINLNDGKTQEYKDRKVYNIGNSKLTHEGVKTETCECEQQTDKAVDGAYLFTTSTCPNCKIACSFLDKAGFKYDKLLANEHADLATEFGVKQAPTLVVVKDGAVSKYAGVSDIKKFLGV